MSKYAIKGHRLYIDGKPAPFKPSPNVGGEIDPRYLVIHFTAGGYAGAVDWLCRDEAKASAHIVVGEDGQVTQLVPFDRKAWHAGVSQWKGDKAINSHSIGIEIANFGQLSKGPKGGWLFGKTAIPAARVKVARHANGGPVLGWHTYPEAQIEAVKGIAAALHDAYGFSDVLGHDQIAPGRKTDPGPAFDMPALRAFVLGNDGTNKAEKDDRSSGGAKPLSQSRTLKGAAASAVGMMGEQAAAAAKQVEAVADASEWLRWAFIALTIIGIGLVVYARIDDSLSEAR